MKSKRFFVFINHPGENEEEAPRRSWSRSKRLSAHPEMKDRMKEAEEEARSKGYEVAD